VRWTIANGSNIVKGTVHGKTIELAEELGLPDGQVVTVTVLPVLPPGEGLRQAFGSWADGGEELDQFLEEVRCDRKHERPDSSG